MSWNIRKSPRLRQPGPVLPASSVLLNGLVVVATPTSPINAIDKQVYTQNSPINFPVTFLGDIPGLIYHFSGNQACIWQMTTTASAGYLRNPNQGWTILSVLRSSSNASTEQVAVCINFNGSTVPIMQGFGNVGGSAASGAAYYNGAWNKSGANTDIRGDNKWHVIASAYRPNVNLEYYIDGRLDAVGAAGTGTSSSNTNALSMGAYQQDAAGFFGDLALVMIWDYALPIPWLKALTTNLQKPYQVLTAPRRRLWFAPQVSNNIVGGATLNLSKITEQGTGITGSVGSATDTLKALTEQATGITGTVGSARDTLKALLESAFGKTGAVGFGTETLKPITVQATGTVQSNNVVGGATLTLKALLESATGRTGVVGSARDSLRAITEQGTGKTGSVGSGQIILKSITVQAFGESGATPLAPADTSRPGGQAWWGYESFDGSSRPWWYKDLKDKACELERLRQQRIEIGLIPPDKVEETVEEVLEFVEEQPTPATADYYVHKAEMLAARVEKLIDNMMEEDDEQAIMEMSKFFFHRKEVTPWQIQ